ncbi:tetratricopeptide repeat protein [Flindersiella endophytica]
MRMEMYSEALEYLEQAYSILVDEKDEEGITNALGTKAVVYLKTGREQEALEMFQNVLNRQTRANRRAHEASTHNNIAIALRLLGRQEESTRYHEEAVNDASTYPELDAEFRIDYGDSLRSWGRFDEARENYDTAEQIAAQIQAVYHRARALEGLGYVAYHAGDKSAAQNNFAEADQLYRSCGVPVHPRPDG